MHQNEYTGAAFKQLITTKLYLFTNEEEYHEGYLCKDGLNVDTDPFYSCDSDSGFFVCDGSSLNACLITIMAKNHIWNLVWIREVEIPCTARVYKDNICNFIYKSDQIILKPRININDYR